MIFSYFKINKVFLAERPTILDWPVNQKFKRTDCGRHVIFKSINSAALDVETFKNHRFTPSGYKDMGIQTLYVL